MANIPLHGLVLPALVYLLARPKTPPVVETPVQDEYDYIVVGSGAAGAALAYRLSEDPAFKVLLLEAGSKDNVTTEVPVLSMTLQGTPYDWQYLSTTEKKACQVTKDKACKLPSGKVVGGSTALSFLGFMRGNKEDYNDWERQGNPGWGYDDLLPYFKKSEDYRVNGDCVESKYHGCGGRMTITAQDTLPKNSEAMIKGLQELGFKETDIDGETQLGYTLGRYNIRDGIKCGAALAYLKSIPDRKNLHISLDSFVTKILIDPETKTANGVAFEKNGETHQVKTKKEVIVSAGAIESPKLLMLSGVGPKEELEKFKIPVIADLPGVGQSFQDHVGSVVPITADRELTKDELGMLSSTSISQWGKGTGPMTSPSGLDLVAFAKSKNSEETSTRPDFEIIFQSLPLLSVTAPFFQNILGFTDETWQSFVEALVDKPMGFIQPEILHPKSRGTIRLKSSDPHDHPEITTNFLTEEEDLKALVESMMLSAALANTSMFRELGYQIEFVVFPACKDKAKNSEGFWECMAQQVTLLRWDYCCTNRMGPESDPKAVVDNRLRVRGVSGLRVVDASIMPEIIGAHLTATVVMIAEKAADMIKEDSKAT